MADANKLREVVERVVSDTLSAHVAALKAEIAERATRELEALVPEGGGMASAGESVPAGAHGTDSLNAAFCTVLDSNSQAEILGALLDGTGRFCQRSALFVIRSGSAVGWRARGFDNDDAIKSINFDPAAGLAGRAYADRQPVQAAAAEFDSNFTNTFGEPLPGTNAVVLPLVLRDKVAALVYCDGGASGRLDPSALECLTRGAGLWLEIVAARKAGAPIAASEPEERADTQRFAAAEPSQPISQPASVAPPAPEPAAPIAASATAPVAAADDEEVHKKAKRFAKLLVDEIKLYNQKKVADGRANKDLYSRLKDDIDKSRMSYEKRYGQTSAGPADYFNQELVRVLCDGDASILGSGYSR